MRVAVDVFLSVLRLDASNIHVRDAEYLENRMGLTITSVWRLFVFDIENVLDGVRCW
jgi:hypothetical protein